MIAWIWKDEYHTDMGLQFDIAATGFNLRGREVKRYQSASEVDLVEGDVLYGTASDLREFDIIPSISDYPPELKKWQIPCEEVSFEEAKKRDYPFFIKPVSHKEFSGLVATSEASLGFVEGNPKVYVADVLKIYSEWRIYILEGNPLKVCHYKGDPLRFPNSGLCEIMIQSFKTAPSAYALDVAVTENGLQMVEINDVFCLGNYGLDSAYFAQMLEARWEEVWSNQR